MTTPLPSAWNLYNLSASPFWQQPLAEGDATHPMSLFVGRKAELAHMTDTIAGAGNSGTRQAVAGQPGIGKTTLVKACKAWARDAGYFTVDSIVPIVSDDTAESLFGRFLGTVYDTILANRPATANNRAMQAAQVLVRASRETLRGGGLSALGFGGSASSSVTTTAPRDMLLDGPRVLRDLIDLVTTSDGRGVLVHVNNLENLSDADAATAGTILRDLRDPMLMHNGLHVIFVGTPEAIAAAITMHEQVRTTVQVYQVNPVPTDDVHTMLRARYAHLRARDDTPVVPPVTEDAVAQLYELFRGDLRGLLSALEDGVRPNIGLTGGANSITFEQLRPALQRRYADALDVMRDEARIEKLLVWGRHGADTVHTQATLQTLWGLRQSSVSTALTALRADGYVVQRPRRTGEPTTYALSGVSRLALG